MIILYFYFNVSIPLYAKVNVHRKDHYIILYTRTPPYFYSRRQCGLLAHHKMRILVHLSSNAQTINREMCLYLRRINTDNISGFLRNKKKHQIKKYHVIFE